MLRRGHSGRKGGSAMLKVYGFARVNKVARGNTRDLRVLWALEEIGMPYEIVGMDHPNHDLDSPSFRAKESSLTTTWKASPYARVRPRSPRARSSRWASPPQTTPRP